MRASFLYPKKEATKQWYVIRIYSGQKAKYVGMSVGQVKPRLTGWPLASRFNTEKEAQDIVKRLTLPAGITAEVVGWSQAMDHERGRYA